MITYQEYMEDSANLHHAFYLEIAQECGINYSKSKDIERIKNALKTDEHLNNIPLREWDSKAESTKRSIDRALRNRGTWYSLAAGVCVHKAAAKEAAK